MKSTSQQLSEPQHEQFIQESFFFEEPIMTFSNKRNKSRKGRTPKRKPPKNESIYAYVAIMNGILSGKIRNNEHINEAIQKKWTYKPKQSFSDVRSVIKFSKRTFKKEQLKKKNAIRHTLTGTWTTSSIPNLLFHQKRLNYDLYVMNHMLSHVFQPIVRSPKKRKAKK